MLIKVMTNRNTERLIEGIETVDIHRSTYVIHNDKELQSTINIGPGVFSETGMTPIGVECFESSLASREPNVPTSTDGYTYAYKFIDYKKDGQWHRLAVECFAYICNDDGKTISKVVNE